MFDLEKDLKWIEDVMINPIFVGSRIFIGNYPGNDNKNIQQFIQLNNYIILEITNICDDEVHYKTLCRIGCNGSDSGSVTLQWAKDLFNQGYWRFLNYFDPIEISIDYKKDDEDDLICNQHSLSIDYWVPNVIPFKGFYPEFNQEDELIMMEG
jgi:hypothetical protein